MLHKLLWTVFGIQSAKFCEDTHVSTLQTQPTFHKRDELIKTTPVLVVFADLLQIVNLQSLITIIVSGLLFLSQQSLHHFPTKRAIGLCKGLGRTTSKAEFAVTKH
jgi:hypothetical protein